MVRAILAAFILTAAPGDAPAQPPPSTGSAESYYQFMLARRLEAKDDVAGALAALKRAAAADPQAAEIQAELSAFHARQNSAAEAVAAGELALTLDPGNAEAHRILGLIYAAWSDGGVPPPAGRERTDLRRRAIEHLTALGDTPAMATDLNLQLTLGRLHLRAGEAARAIPVLERIVSQAPFIAEPYSLLAEARLAVGRVDEAAEALERAAELNPRFYVSLGELFERQLRWAEAAGAYGRAIESMRAPTRELRLRWIGTLLSIPDGIGAARAREALTALLADNPNDMRGLYLLSTASRQLQDLAGAEQAARTMLARDPASVSGLYALSLVLFERQRHQEIVELLTPAARNAASRSGDREPDGALLLAQLGYAHLELKQHEQAVSAFTRAVDRDPMNAPILNSLGYLLADRGERLQEAVGFIERALKIDPDNPAYLDSLGWALFKQGRAADAEPYLRKAAAALQEQSVIQDHLGDVLFRQGKIQEAIAAWERALGGDGEEIDRAAVEKKIKDARGRRP